MMHTDAYDAGGAAGGFTGTLLAMIPTADSLAALAEVIFHSAVGACVGYVVVGILKAGLRYARTRRK